MSRIDLTIFHTSTKQYKWVNINVLHIDFPLQCCYGKLLTVTAVIQAASVDTL